VLPYRRQAPASRLEIPRRLAFAVGLLLAAPGVSAPYPSAPYSTVGGPPPVGYCRGASDGAAASRPGTDLETVGCISASGDGLYGNSGGGDTASRVEQSVLLATGEAVALELYRESGSGSSAAGGIQVWVEAGGKEIRWAFERTLIDLIEAGTLDIGYLTIKAANGYALYAIPTGIYAGRYSTEGLQTNGGRQPAVSHVRFWKEVDVDSVPEPGTLALLGLGVIMLGWRRRPIGPGRPLPVRRTSG